ncbi:Bug family tripartite tricarboxylate transporter substrate binding protein [Belnapia rosea]|uniref:Tripartite-type tricarboxylate transporter, receptor component TctC n=1 Tax=Belnapia rosea TaxID=938405 RepID=A0A1G6SQK7_9PROT|nr:tripartite tricarboxylate transporter substrate-binding protein [Belnapia rosea]SDD18497.1 Tripartite-type tricarboxylate transporter, receptor component TctC [Belnapia rosea]
MPIARRAALALPLAALGRPAAAQPWPPRPPRLVVPYAPGGLTDILARALAAGLGAQLGQQVVVENRPGANTIIGAGAVAQAAPDGLTLLMASGASTVLNPLLYRQLPYDAARDLLVVGIVVETPLVMVVPPGLPVRSVAEFVAHAKARPDGVNYASVGLGNPIQLAAELFAMGAGVPLTNVVYPGSAPALLALTAGEVQVMFDVIGTSLPQIREGRLRALAVTTRERLAVLPDVPTIAESGLPGYQATTWFGIAVPRAVPEPVLARLRTALAAVQQEPEFVRRFADLGLAVQPPLEAAAIEAYLAEERERWGGVIRAKGISLGAAP